MCDELSAKQALMMSSRCSCCCRVGPFSSSACASSSHGRQEGRRARGARGGDGPRAAHGVRGCGCRCGCGCRGGGGWGVGRQEARATAAQGRRGSQQRTLRSSARAGVRRRGRGALRRRDSLVWVGGQLRNGEGRERAATQVLHLLAQELDLLALQLGKVHQLATSHQTLHALLASTRLLHATFVCIKHKQRRQGESKERQTDRTKAMRKQSGEH